MDEENIDFSDPISALRKNLIFNKNFVPEFFDETKAYYKKAQTTLVKEIPMKTYRKHRYGTGINVDLLQEDELPEHRDILTLNTPRILRNRFFNKNGYLTKKFEFNIRQLWPQHIKICLKSFMTQTACYEELEPEEEELEVFQEDYQMIRPSFDFSAATVTKEEHLSWAQENIERENLPTAVLRPTTPTQPKVMRGITSGIGMDINSQPGVERIVGAFDDATIGSSDASTAKLRRTSQYAPTSDNSKPKKIPIAADSEATARSEWDFEIEYDGQSTISTSTYRPVARPDDYEGKKFLKLTLEIISITLNFHCFF